MKNNDLQYICATGTHQNFVPGFSAFNYMAMKSEKTLGARLDSPGSSPLYSGFLKQRGLDIS